MSGFITGQCRTQATLFPERIDDYLDDENPVRVIDAFVDMLDLSLSGIKTESASTGIIHPMPISGICVSIGKQSVNNY